MENCLRFPNVKEEGKVDISDDDTLSCLDGFCIVLSNDNDIIYVSNNVSQHIGLTSTELIGQSIYDYVHPCDHNRMQSLTEDGEDGQVDRNAKVFVRIKVTMTDRGRMVNLRQASYKVVRLSGTRRTMRQTEDLPPGVDGSVFLGIAQLLGNDAQNRDQL